MIAGRGVVVDAVPAHHGQEIGIAEFEAARSVQVSPHATPIGAGNAPPVRCCRRQRVCVVGAHTVADVAAETQQLVPAAGLLVQGAREELRATKDEGIIFR